MTSLGSNQITFPYEAIAIKKYKSPHKNDLSFAKGDRIRVTAFAPKDEDEEEDEDEDDRWLIGETLDGSKTGTFPAGNVEQAPPQEQETTTGSKEDGSSSNLPEEPVAVSQEPLPDSNATIDTSEKETKVQDTTTEISPAAKDQIDEAPSISPPVAVPEQKLSSDQAPAVAVEPVKKPSSPPLAPKPSGLAARIAAFNKPQDAPPPIPRGKPGGGWKPPPPAAGGPKPVLPGPSAAQLNRTTSRSGSTTSSTAPISTSPANDSPTPESVLESQTSKVNSGFSAADAQTSIKMSLKERMAALQRNDASSAQKEAAAAKPAPKPAPKRIDEERRSAALASLGSASAGAEEEAKEYNKEDAESNFESKEIVEKDQEALSLTEEKEDVGGLEDSPQPLAETTEEQTEEKTEEELEAERRAAIAKRMAALGGRRMGGGPGPAMFGAPAPPSKPRQLSTDSRNTNDSAVKEDETDTKAEPSQEMEENEVKPEKMLAVPRRTAPPRKKKSSASSQPTIADEKERSPSAEVDRKESIDEEKGEHSATSGEKVSAASAAEVGAAAGIGAAAVGATILDKDDTLLTDEPKSTQDIQEEEEQVKEHTSSPPQVIEPEQEDDLNEESQSQGILVNSRRLTQDSNFSSRRTERTDSFEPSTPVSQSELEEHARQLADFIRTPEVEKDNDGLGPISGDDQEPIDSKDLQNADEDERTAEEEVPFSINRAAVSSPPPPNNAPPLPPSARPPVPKSSISLTEPNENDEINRFSSPPPTRAPPVPKSSLPPSQDVEDRAISPAPSRPPPVPRSSLPPSADLDTDRTTSPAPTRAPPIPSASPVGRRESSLMASIEDLQTNSASTKEADSTLQTTLAAPKPRMAIPADESEDEDEGVQEERGTTVSPPPSNDTKEAPSEELTEEEEERQRRSRLAERMARMGGLPIMGAPMPFRKPPVPVAEPEEVTEKEEEPTAEDEEENAEEAEEDTVDAPQTGTIEDNDPTEPIAQARSESTNLRNSIASPPPVPTMSPPPPTRSPDMAKRSSQSYVAGSDLTRSGSRSRPPVPTVSHSRGATNEEIAEMEAAADPIAQQPPLTRIASPPALPSSPPPRPPSHPPPNRRASAISTDARDVAESNQSIEQGLMRTPSTRLSNPGPTAAVQQDSSSSGLKGVQPSAPSSRDIDLMPSSQWWRHGRPVRLPPTLMRPDAGRNVEVQDEGIHHLIRIDLIFEDYSSTAISVKYQDDDANEQYTEIAQRHNFAPMRPNTQELMSWSQQIGSRIARQASALLSKGSTQPIQIGDGTSKGFITALIAMSTAGYSLPPVGYSFGSIILAQAATTVVDQGADEIRPGDIVALHGTDFKGKKGLTSYHVTFGSAQEPAFACVIETTLESKKKKIRCVLVPTSSSAKSGSKAGTPEEVSLRLDDIKSGLLRVFRVAPKNGWLPE